MYAYIGTSDISIFDFELDGNHVYLIDTPGFNDTNRSDVETLRVLATYLSASYAQNVFIHGIIYLHPIANNRMSGSSKRNIDMFKALCGYSTYDNVAIATTFWNRQERRDFLQREAELRDDSAFFGGIVTDGARLFRHGEFGLDAQHLRDSARSIVRHVIVRSRLAPVVLLIQHELVDEHKALDQTKAGAVVVGELRKVAEDYRRQLGVFQKDLEHAMGERNSNHKAEIADLKTEFQEKLMIMDREHTVLKSSLAKLQEREQQALLDKLKATEQHFEVLLKRKEEELRDQEESLRLMKEEAARQDSTRRLKANQEVAEQENEVVVMKQDVQKGQTDFKKLRDTTKDIQGGIVSGIAGSVTTAILTGTSFNQQVAVGIALLILLI